MVRATGQKSDSLGEGLVNRTFCIRCPWDLCFKSRFLRPTRWSFLGDPEDLLFTQLLQAFQAQ